MYKDLLNHTPLLALPIMAMFVFLAVFLMVVARTLTHRRGAYHDVAHLPIEPEGEDDHG